MDRVTVATYNIHHGAGLDGRVDLVRLAERIRASKAELVALQELDRNLERSGLQDQPRMLGEMLDAEVHFLPNLVRDRGDFGIGLLCSGASLGQVPDLPPSKRGHPRAAIIATWRDFSIVATHLSPDKDSRRAQLPALAAVAGGLPPPVLVLGDLNCGKRDLGDFFSRGFTSAPGWRRTTDRGWPRQIDHILAGPGARVERSWTIGGGASDHRLVAAEIATD